MRIRNFACFALTLVGVTTCAAVWPDGSTNAYYIVKFVEPETLQLPRKGPRLAHNYQSPKVQLLVRTELPGREKHSLLEEEYSARIRSVGPSADGSRGLPCQRK